MVDTMTASFGNQPRDRAPRVSIVVIFLNGEPYLSEAVESVIGQTFEDWELLLVDDGSTDASTDVAKDYVSRFAGKIRYLEHPGHANRGMSATRNLGIKHARGEYIAFIDADDVWLPSKLADQVAILDSRPEVGMVCGTTIYWSSWSGGEDRIVPSGSDQDRVLTPPEPTLTFYPLGRGAAPCPSDFIVRASLIKDVAGFEEHFSGQNQLYEDQGFLAKVYLRSPIYVSSKTWLKYRLHEKSCVATVTGAGKYHEVRRYFLTWFERYAADTPNLDNRIHRAIKLALRPYRNPKRDLLLKLPRRGVNFSRRAFNAISRRIWNAA